MNAISTIAATSGMLALSIAPKALADALAAMRASGGAQIIERRNTIPILGCVLLDAQPGKLTLYGTNLDVVLAIELAADVDGSGRVAIEFEALHKAAKSAKGETVRLVDMGGASARTSGRATLQHDGGTASLPTRLGDDFPFIPTPDGLALFEIDGPTLKRDLDRAASCISTEETRYYLNGVFFHLTRLAPPLPRTAEHDAAADELGTLRGDQRDHEQREQLLAGLESGAVPEDQCDDPETVATRVARIAELEALCAAFEAERNVPDSLCMAATDGHRLARLARPIPTGAPTAMPDVILPSGAVHWIRRVGLKGCAGSAHLYFSGSKFVFQRGNMRLVGKLVDGTFPDYSRVIPSQGGHRMTFPADALADAAKLAHGHCSGKTRAMLLSIGEGWATVRATCPDNGTVAGLIDGSAFEPQGEAEQFGLGMNAKYLGELMASRKGEAVTLTAADCGAPILIEGDDSPEFVSVLMPMRVDGDICTPDDMRKAGRDAIEIFAEDMPAKLKAIAKLEAEMDTPDMRSNSYFREALATARRGAGTLVTAAIDLMAARTGWPRYQARATILRDLADMKGAVDPLAARAAAAKEMAAVRAGGRHGPPSAPASAPIYVAEQAPEPEPVESQPDEPDGEAIDAPRQPDEPARPMFASLQEFKAAAGQGTRWTVENFNGTEWGGLRSRTVATVRARSIGFLGEDATIAQCRAADVRGNGGRSWIEFPPKGEWSSDAEGLVIHYPARDGEEMGPPKTRLRQLDATAESAAEPVADVQPGALEAMRAMVADLSARVAAMEAARVAVEARFGAPAVAAVEAADAPVRRSPAHERAIRRAWTERAKRRASDAARRNLVASIDVANAELAAKSGTIARLSGRIARLAAVLAGRKRQIAALGRDLLVARNRAADLRTAGETVPTLASVPAGAKPAPQPPARVAEPVDDAGNFAAAC